MSDSADEEGSQTLFCDYPFYKALFVHYLPQLESLDGETIEDVRSTPFNIINRHLFNLSNSPGHPAMGRTRSPLSVR